MGKGDHRARARQLRAKAEAVGLTPLAKTKTKAKQPRQEGRFVEATQDARETALQARCRLFGVRDTKEARQALSGQHSGSAIGFVMQATMRPDEIAPLWSTWQAFCSAERTYRMRIIGRTGDPQSASLPLLPEPMQTDDGHTVDLRDSDQRDRDAVNGWMRWRGYIGCLSAAQRVALHHAERDDGPAIWHDCKATAYGLATLGALKALHEVAAR